MKHTTCAGCEPGMPWEGLPCPKCCCDACERTRGLSDFGAEVLWHAMTGTEPPWGEVFADGANSADIVELRDLS